MFLIGMLFMAGITWSQQSSSYNMELVRAVQFNSEGQNHILTIFKVIPAIKDFKLIMSMRVTYEIGQGAKVVNVQKQKEDHINITIYGKNVQEKSQKVYDWVKDKLNLNTEEDIRLIVFDFHDITKTQVDNMTVIYGLWESNNENIRNEKTFTFKVENSK